MTAAPHEALTHDQCHELLTPNVAIQEALERVNSIDFGMLKQKLIQEQGWTQEICDAVEDLYRKFLALNITYPDRKICPSGSVDAFWHAHILDTRAYAADCEALFGRMLHHFPYFGMRGPDDKLDLERAFAETVELFIVHFGIDPTGGDTEARSCRPQRCP